MGFFAGFRAWRANLNADFAASKEAERRLRETQDSRHRYFEAAFKTRLFPAVMAAGLGMGAMLAWVSQEPGLFFAAAWATFMGYLVIVPRLPALRARVDAQRAREPAKTAQPEATPETVVARTLATLPLAAQHRFLALRQRCADMRDIASEVRGETPDEEGQAGSGPELDHLLFLFLRLLVSQRGLDRFVKSTSEAALQAEIDKTKAGLAAAQAAADERLVRSLQDSLVDDEQRLGHYRACAGDAQFVAAELDRLETKIEILAEMGVNGQDAAAVRREIVAAVDSTEHAETTIDRLKHFTDLLGDADDVTPPFSIGAFRTDAEMNRAR